ncbi:MULTISPECIES: sensor histidine kinase [unclassified Streptomyces]|uniref:sensor histidine kinase n=1 Tax=unclassified Streptomyces TaxID=2593676 RepID=UPI001660645E|nr:MULTISPECIES: HAMP domain-containing sensor histidine kinase [unclassified Streptomyces]MBD0709316.1 two-component sensor histidine kinase [Streptomyces sp. CBMA291]MBD0712594.1 two-component sensor histidine kinase [Streptomyces sp. CBMA370]
MTRRPRPGAGRRTWSLRTRLVVSAVALIAIVAAVIGTVTTIAFRSYLYDQADEQLGGLTQRAAGPPVALPVPDPVRAREPLAFLGGPGVPIGSLGAALTEDGVSAAGYSTEVAGGDGTEGPRFPIRSLDEAQSAALATVPRDGRPHTVELPGGLGSYRVAFARGGHGAFLAGIPLAEVEDTLSTLVLVELSVTGAGLVAASLAGTVLVGVALRPLRRVVATAGQVAQLPLHSGEVALHQRVPETEADPRTEVGQVGAALNRMLDHVHSALDARQQSETRVRRFVADASHELRTPLASIRGYAELTRLGGEECGPDTRHALGRIESEAVRMTGLVEDLLLLARLDTGRPLSYEDTDLVPLVVDAVSDARAAGPEYHWSLELPEDGGTPVRGDRARLHQVLVNLLANARTHTPPGTRVTARVRPAADSVTVLIEDDGPGIPPELLPTVFERFARGDASRSRTAGSTGLGLAIVRAVVLAHEGEVSVDSAPGRTVFTVLLPYASPSQARHRLVIRA